MPDEDSSDSDEHQQPSFWRGLRALLFGDESEATLRDQIEEAIENH